jgi:hypothetical protein
VEKSTFAFFSRKPVTTGLLWVLGLLNALVYWRGIVRPASLLELFSYPRQDLFYLWKRPESTRWEFVTSFALLGVLYGLAYLVARRAGSRSAWLATLAGSLVFAFILCFMQPFDAADIYDNIMHGRILGIYGANPFIQVPATHRFDPFYFYVGWKNSPSAYGPAWELLAGMVARLAGRSNLGNVFAFKALSGAFLWGCIFIVARALNKEEAQKRLAGTLLLAWNPIVLYITWGNGHNDAVMLFWILLAYLALSRRRAILAGICLSLGILVKFIPVLLFPALVLVNLQGLPSLRQKLILLSKICLSAAFMIVLFYLPFWQGFGVLSLPRRLQLFSASLPSVIYHTTEPALGSDLAAKTIGWSAFALTIIFVLWRSATLQKEMANLHASMDRDPEPARLFIRAAFDILALYLLVTCLWFQGWYSLWLLALIPLVGSGWRIRLALVFGAAAILKQFVVAPALFLPQPKLSQPQLEIYFTLGVMGLPWLYCLGEWIAKQLPGRLAATTRLVHP